MTSSDGEIWRLTNASGQITYRLDLIDNSTNRPMLMQLISIDGVSISVPQGTSPGTVMTMGANKFTVADCQSGGTALLPVCVSELVMMPSARAEVWVTYRNSDGAVVSPPVGATATLQQGIPDLGPAGESWPQINLAGIEFAQSTPTRAAVDVTGNARAALSPQGIFGRQVPSRRRLRLRPTPAGRWRRGTAAGSSTGWKTRPTPIPLSVSATRSLTRPASRCREPRFP